MDKFFANELLRTEIYKKINDEGFTKVVLDLKELVR
jgi:hypothetical protein